MPRLTLEISINRVGDGVEPIIRNLNELGNAASNATARGKSGADSMTASLRNAYVQVMALKEGFEVIKSIVQRGFDFNAELQKSNLLLGAMLYKNQAIYDSTGKAVTGTEKLNVSLGIAGQLQDRILAASLKYGLAYQGIADTAQMILATSQGQVKSLESLVELSVKLNKAGTVMGINPFMMMRDTRDLMAGRPTMLSQTLGISQSDLDKMRASGDIVGELNKRLDVFMMTSERFRTTLPGALGAAKNAFDMALGEGTKKQTEELTKMLNDLVDQIVVFDKDGHAAFDPAFVSAVSAIADAFMGVARALALIGQAIVPISRGFTVLVNSVGGAMYWIAEQVYTIPEHISQTIGDLLNTVAAEVQKHPTLAKLIGVPNAGELRSMAGFFGRTSATFAAIRETQTFNKDQSFDAAAAAALAQGPAAQLTQRGSLGSMPPKLTDEQLRAIELSKARVDQMNAEQSIAETQAKLESQKLGLLQQQLGIETEIRAIGGLTAGDQEKTIAQLRTIYGLAAQYMEAQAKASKGFDENQKAFDRAQQSAIRDKNLIGGQRTDEISAARDVQRAKDDAVQAQLDLDLAQVRQKFADNERQITQDFLDEVAKRNKEQLPNTLADIHAQVEYDGRYVKAQRAMYDDLAQYGAQATQQGLVSVFSGGNLRGAAHSFIDSFHQSLAKMLTTDVSTFLDRIAAQAGGRQFYDPKTGTYRYATDSEKRTAQYEQMGIQGATALYGLYQSGRDPGVSRTQNSLSGAMQGAAIGAVMGPVGALVGAAIGAIAGALLTKDKPWYTVSVSGGQVSITGQNTHAADLSQATAAINASITQGQASIDALFSAFPTAIAQGLKQKGLADILTGGSRKFNDATLKQFENVDIQKMFLDAYVPVISSALNQLGVSDPRVQQLIAEAKTKDPSQAFQFITDYVTAFVQLQDYVEFMKKSVGEKSSIAVSTLNKTPAEQLADYNTKILALVDGFDQLTNDQQIARVKQINDLTAQRYQLELQYLNDIKNAQTTIGKSIREQLFGMQVQGASGPGAAMALINARRSTIAGQLATATTPAEITQLAQDYQQLTSQLYQFAVQVRDQFKSLLDGFQALKDLPGKDAEAGKSPVEQVQDLTARIRDLGNGFDQLTSDQQIQRGQEILDLANQRYAVEKAAMQQIIDLTKSITDSVDKQIFEIEQSTRTPQQQTGALLDRQRKLYDIIRNSKSADEVNAAMGELQSNANTLLQLLGPNGAQQVIDMLTAARDLSLQKLHDFGAMLQGQMDSTQQAIQNITDTLQKSFDTASATVTQLGTDLQNFGDHAIAALQGLADAIDPIDASLDPLQKILDQFGGALGDTGDQLVGIGGPGGDLDQFGKALDVATDKVAAFGNTFGGGPGSGGKVLQFRPPDPVVLQPVVQVQIAGSAEPFIQTVAARASVIINSRASVAARAASRLTRSGGL